MKKKVSVKKMTKKTIVATKKAPRKVTTKKRSSVVMVTKPVVVESSVVTGPIDQTNINVSNNADEDKKCLKVPQEMEDIVNKFLEAKNKLNSYHQILDEDKKTEVSLLKSTLKTVAEYAKSFEEVAVTSEEEQLPKFWQELKSARELFEKFDNFYARKYVDHVLALRKMTQEEQALHNLSKETDCSGTSLYASTKAYLKTRRDLEVIKKVLETTYQEFHKTNITQVETDYLQTEMAKYTNNSHEGLDNLFDHLGPSKEAYDRAMAHRATHLSPSAYHRRILPSFTLSSEDKKKTDDTNPNLRTKEGREVLHKELKEIDEIYKTYFKETETKPNFASVTCTEDISIDEDHCV